MSRRQPQDDLNDGNQILWFDDLGSGNEKHRFLSNFYEGEPLYVPGWTWEGLFPEILQPETTSADLARVLARIHPTNGEVRFATGEHAFAAMKTRNFGQFFHIVNAKGPNEAKALGRRCDLRPDWEAVKLDVMAAVIRAKFDDEREEAGWLVGTGEAILAEGTYWHDTVWGVDLTRPTEVQRIVPFTLYPGRNWLGTLLMARRAELRCIAYAQETGYWNGRFASTGRDS